MSIDWSLWLESEKIRVWQAAGLSCGIDPRKRDCSELIDADVPDFKRRLATVFDRGRKFQIEPGESPHLRATDQLRESVEDFLEAYRRGRPVDKLKEKGNYRVSLEHFAKVAVELTWKMPAEMTEIATGVRVPDWEAECERLRLKLDQATNELHVLDARRQKTAFKLILGMATAKYKHKPEAKQSQATELIVRDLQKQGYAIEADTVRRWLAEAYERLGNPR